MKREKNLSLNKLVFKLFEFNLFGEGWSLILLGHLSNVFGWSRAERGAKYLKGIFSRAGQYKYFVRASRDKNKEKC